MKLLSQNSELKKDGIWNWSLPAWNVKLSDGTWFNTCPNADFCAQVCYARNGTYLFPNVIERHLRNLEYTLNDLIGWKLDMIDEINRLGPKKIEWLRIHDSGDFYNDKYLQAWIDISINIPEVKFYSYTKEVSRFNRMVKNKCPKNFMYLFSMGGKEDHLIDLEIDRHVDVFPDMESMVKANYTDQSANDTLSVTLPTLRIGIEANNIPHFKKKLAHHTFSSGQADRMAKRENH